MPRQQVETPPLEVQLEIIKKLRNGDTQKRVAELFGIKAHAVGRIWRSRVALEEQRNSQSQEERQSDEQNPATTGTDQEADARKRRSKNSDNSEETLVNLGGTHAGKQPKLDDQPSTSRGASPLDPVSTVSTISKKQKLETRPSVGSASCASASDMDSSEEYEDSGNESSGEDVEFVEDKDGRSNDITSEDDYPFVVLSTEAIVQHMIDSIRDANTVLQLPPTTMRILLNHFGWDKEKLLEAYYDTDQEQLFKEARVINPHSSRSLPSIPTIGAEDCEICYLQKPSSMMYGMECGHRFCVQCWNEYLTTKIMEEGMGQTIACAAHNCPILVDDATVMKLLTDPKVKLKYQHLITNSFVQCNRLMRWCPSADCTNAIRVQYNDWRPVTCICGFKFCFQCGNAWHDPVKCSWLKKWLKKCDDDSETSNWIAANTKECPKCNATIEKDGGCNHMVCKNQNCKADFCWVCLGPWEPHGSSWYNCNRYDELEAKSARDAQEKSRAALQRYLFYCNRYMNHMQSLKFEHKLYASVKDKMEEMQQHNMSWIEVQFLKKAVDILCLCRQTLMYTYVFAFYLVKANQSVIFEDNQRDLESATEKLSEYLERDITSENLADIKQKVQDKYRYCESRRKVLLEHVYEGYEKDWWVYNDC